METVHNRDYNNIPIGLAVRGSINDEYTYRVRPGNGFYDAKKGKVYQDKYAYFVPGSINNAASQPYRQQWIAAVHKWKEDLSDADKQQYNHIAMRGLHMSGYNLFMRRAMKGEIDMYVDRGDPAAYDYAKEDLDLDGAWHDLDLSALVPAGAKAVFIMGHIEGTAVDWGIIFRKKGNTNEVNHGGMETLRAGVERHRSSTVSLDADRVIQYKADNQSWTTLDLSVRGWWT